MLFPCIFLCCSEKASLLSSSFTHFSPTIFWFCFLIFLAIGNKATSSLLLNLSSRAFLSAFVQQLSLLPYCQHFSKLSIVFNFPLLHHLWNCPTNMSVFSICPSLTNRKRFLWLKNFLKLFKICPYVINFIRIIYPVIHKKIV